MSLDSSDGTLTCVSCGNSIPITDFEHHEFGNIKNSQYIKKYAAKNKDLHTDGFTTENYADSGTNTSISPVCYIPFELNSDDVKTFLCKKPFGKLFFTKNFKRVVTEQLFEKIYVPVWSHKILAKGSINAACTEFDRDATNYYDVEKHAQLLFEQFNTVATTMNGPLHIESLFPYKLDGALYANEYEDKKIKKKDGIITLEADIPPDRYEDNIKKYADRASKDKLNTLLSGYSSAHNKIFKCDSNVLATKLIYLPVWKIPFGTKDASECMYVNGQTGKSSGKLPISKMKSTAFILLTFIVIFAALISAAYFAGL